MLRKLKAFMLCGFIVMVMAVPSAHADVKEGWYYGLGAGAAIPTDGEWTSATNTGDFDYDTGYLFSGAVGYKFGMPRLEAEISYQTNDYDRINQNGAASVNASGDISSLAFMANIYIDFTNDSSFTPFILAGIGAANVEADLTNNAGVKVVDDDETGLAYQVGAGFAIDLGDDFILDFKYCYFVTGDQDFANLQAGTGTIENEFESHNMTIGFRYSF